MEAIARLRHLQASPQKVRLVVDLIRGMDVEQAAVVLRTVKKAAAKPIEKLLKSAVANAENRDQNVDVGKLYVKEVFVDGGPSLKRIQANTMGRAFRILKRQSHVTIKLDTRKSAVTSTSKRTSRSTSRGTATSAAKSTAKGAAKSTAKNTSKSPAKNPAKSAAKSAKGSAKGGK